MIVEKLDATPTAVRGEAAVPVATAVRYIAVAVGEIARDVTAASVVSTMNWPTLPWPTPDVAAQHDVSLAVRLVLCLRYGVRPETVRIVASVGYLAVLNENILVATMEAVQPEKAAVSQTCL